MSEKEWLSKGLDKAVIPLVEFFNKNGLSTVMSCQGHNKPISQCSGYNSTSPYLKMIF